MTHGDGSKAETKDSEVSVGQSEPRLVEIQDDSVENSLVCSDNAIVRELARVVTERGGSLELLRQPPGAVEDAFHAAAPLAQAVLIDTMLNASSDKVKMLAADKMLNKAGHGGVHKVAIRKHISLEMDDVKALAKVLEEDEG
jgi:hypothetical protein